MKKKVRPKNCCSFKNLSAKRRAVRLRSANFLNKQQILGLDQEDNMKTEILFNVLGKATNVGLVLALVVATLLLRKDFVKPARLGRDRSRVFDGKQYTHLEI